MKEIPLSTGQVALVDDEDFDRVVAAGYWYAVKRPSAGGAVFVCVRHRTHGYMHGFILGGRDSERRIKHFDGNGLNNQKSNLSVSVTYSKGVGEIKCRACGRVLPEDAFFYRRNQECYFKDCRDCSAKKPQSLARKRKSHLKKEYGLTPERWALLFEKQSRRCAICKTDSVPRNFWHTDHCHRTKIVRGILCLRCNLLLGKVDDDPEILKNAVEYLHNFPAKEVITNGEYQHGDPGKRDFYDSDGKSGSSVKHGLASEQPEYCNVVLA
jgi:hypothetical protein